MGLVLWRASRDIAALVPGRMGEPGTRWERATAFSEHGRWYAGGMELEEVLAVVRAFNERGVEYVLIGGVAVNLHGLVRGTEDVD